MKLVTCTRTLVNKLSFTEGQAIRALVVELNGRTKLTIISGEIGGGSRYTKSTINNALAKLEITGILRSRGLGEGYIN
ncbi:hypothetical protein [Bacillus sp. UNCCL81]|uniref:hypothetical protein n=1 Tax=Bacillus sp. UNCCL81 TaxID=1502755 RepID=UPI0008ED6270|nr:hypothetical protein [Bacillus sp. UNCCL81]SFC52795.1 CodY helix-turn-helix domain-containing protein [Bacillus sp. UNCCL81]